MSRNPIHKSGFAKHITGDSRTQQHMLKETEMSHKVNQYMRTGVLGNPQNNRKPIYADFSSIDFMEMRNAIADIQQEFASLPARLRGRFQNDPHQLVRFVENPANYEEAMRLGLLPRAEPEIQSNPTGPGDSKITPDRPAAPSST